MELTVTQITLLGTAASVITQLLRLLANKFGWKPGREMVNIGLFVLALGIGVFWFGIPVIGGDDPFILSTEILQAALSVVGAAGLIYNVLLNKVLLTAN
jgi:hypothetical protein